MSVKIKHKIFSGLIIFASIAFLAFSSNNSDKKGRLDKPGDVNAAGSAYTLRINKLHLPLNNIGVLANVSFEGLGEGQYDGKGVLFSGGFMMSGKNGGLLWSNGVATASRISDYVAGEVGMDRNDPKTHLYVVNSQDEPFGTSWQEWQDAVSMGAYFYDGDSDGAYNPVDKNGNGEWDEDEDMPDLLGDETVWCVYNDGLERSTRAFTDQDPQGIEIRQTIWGYATSGDLGNIVFVRYSINNAGTVADVFDSVYFSVWDDVDLGGGDGYVDDIIGCDTTLNAGFTYNDGPDATFGADPPCFLVDFFQGPWLETGNPEDLAFNTKGPLLGIDTVVGALNLRQTSFVHYEQGVGDPDNAQQLRNFLLGKTQNGANNNPCATPDLGDAFGTVLGGVDCSTIPPEFMYSGDPVAQIGWINNYPTDQRQLLNTGPFLLEKDKPVDIVAAYVVGRSTSALNSVVKAKQLDRAAQFVFDNNFNFPAPPPAVRPVIKTTDNTIELVWETKSHLDYEKVGRGFDMVFESYEVYMHQTNSLSEQEGGRTNTLLIASYDVANDLTKVIYEDPVSLERTIVYNGGTQLDSATYVSAKTGRIKLTITTDPFTNGPLIKGKPYFISIVPTAYNRDEIVKLDALGNYLIPSTAAVGNIAGLPVILNDGISGVGIVPGKDTYAPYKEGVPTEKVSGGSTAEIKYSIVDRTKTTNDTYEVSFKIDSSSTLYNLLYTIKNQSTGTVLFDSLQFYDTYDIRYAVDGVMLNVEWVPGGVDTVEFSGDEWFTSEWVHDSVGVFYVGQDLEDPNGVPEWIAAKSSTKIHVSDTRRVELRFGQPGKAYRYVRKPVRFVSGTLDTMFVDVPFQAWIKDDKYGEERQLAVGFTETYNNDDILGTPDRIYDPGTDVAASKEYIVIFNSPYDPTGSQVEYTGTGTGTAAQRFADLGNGYTMDPNNPATNDSIAAIAKSPYFNAMFVVGLQRKSGGGTFSPTGTYSININYPLTPQDVYNYKVNVDLSADEERELFNKINVFPNPLFAYNAGVSYTGGKADEPYVTFSNLPNEITVKIFSLGGNLIRSLEKNNSNPSLTWDLLNEDGLRVASGMYLAIVSNPKFGNKVLKFAIIMPQKQILKY